MSYLHCHNCQWEQDNFWSKDYNPINCLDWVIEMMLFYAEDLDVQSQVSMDRETVREYVIGQLQKSIKKIENMKYRTFEEFKELNPEHKCPKCGKILDIDQGKKK